MSKSMFDNLSLRAKEFTRNQALSALTQDPLAKEWGTWHYDLIFKKLSWSEELTDIFKIEGKKGQGFDPYINLVVEEDRERVKKALNLALEEGKIDALMHKVQLKNGNIKTLFLEIKIAYDNAGKPLIVFGTLNDVTETKHVQSQEVKLLNVIQHSVNEIYLFDADTLKFLYINDGALNNSGYQVNEVKQMTPLDIKPEFTEQKFQDLIKPLIDGSQEKVLFETVHLRKDGSLYPVEIHLQLMGHGDNKAFLAIVLDITQRKKAEEKIRQSHNSLKDQNKQLLRFCDLVLDNLKEPLKNLADLTEDLEKASEEATRKNLIPKLRPEVTHLQETFEYLIEGLRVSQSLEMDSKWNDLESALKKSLGKFESELVLYSPKIDLDLKEVKTIKCPPKYFDSILENLLSNAFKYHSPERKLHIIVGAEHVNDSTLLTIKDNGIGMQIKGGDESIFEIKPQKKHPNSKGFGLFLTKTQVDAIGGTIWVESEEGKGTTFFVEFPNQK
ncbi:PAS domain S-box protein [Litoribacter alkaliphilus]|uniref:histidine kinase n=1 Tax=Litoribacter ruber TaxID=702568 RepID=A0AAP2CEK0_9BACT|nr:PAS domain S-box protein [Litoribacter alkaliphilus]MBS9523018.1 PAS domain S-box protein [Litoribacter alkaliphilus]